MSSPIEMTQNNWREPDHARPAVPSFTAAKLLAVPHDLMINLIKSGRVGGFMGQPRGSTVRWWVYRDSLQRMRDSVASPSSGNEDRSLDCRFGRLVIRKRQVRAGEQSWTISGARAYLDTDDHRAHVTVEFANGEHVTASDPVHKIEQARTFVRNVNSLGEHYRKP